MTHVISTDRFFLRKASPLPTASYRPGGILWCYTRLWTFILIVHLGPTVKFKVQDLKVCHPYITLFFSPLPHRSPLAVNMGAYLHTTDHQYLPDQTFTRPGLGLLTSSLHYSVKQESRTPSPDLADFQQFQFNFQPGSSSGRPQVQSNSAHRPLYRFGSNSPLVSPNSWPSSSTSSVGRYPDLTSMHNTVSFDDFEDADELSELPPVTNLPGQHGTNTSQEKTVRRRSSKGMFID